MDFSLLLSKAPLSALVATCIVLAFIGFAYGTVAAASHERSKRQLPPSLPFALPLLGHLPEFLWNTQKFLGRATRHFAPTTPVRIQLLNRRISILNGAKNIAALFKSSRYLGSEQWLVQVLVNGFGVETADAPFYLADNTGIGHQPDPGSNITPLEHRIFYLVYQSIHDGLSGSRLEEMQRQLVLNLSTQIADIKIGHDAWTEVPDLYGSFIQKLCFKASTTSLLGSRIWDVVPNLEADFWDFDRHLPNLFREVPSWLSPASYKARDKMKHNLEQWHTLAHENCDVDQEEDKGEQTNWEPYFGSRMMRVRHAFFKKMPLSKGTIAADDLGLLWAATANAVPAIGWMLLEILQRPALLERVRAEISPHVIMNPADLSSADEMAVTVDIDSLCQQPLIQSVYAEVLRVRNGTVVARVPKVSDFRIDGWHFPKDQPIMVSSFDTARNPLVWNQGTSEDQHPLDDFWADRFLVDSKNATSGPVLDSSSRINQHKEIAGDETPSKPTSQQFTLDGTEGSWIPYGGGSPMFLTVFEIELLAPQGGGSWIEHDPRYFMFGVMHPKGPIPARIRKRRVAIE